jgi:acyl-CoA synthetase (AMP-forming)/AMP-acid ligase II
VKAVIVLREGMKATEEEIIEHCKKHLASYKKPKSVDFVPELPKNPYGKVLRRKLREKYWVGQERMVH